MLHGMLRCEFLKFSNRVGFLHDGILFPGQRNGVGVIHVHGSLQNFYSTGFIPALASAYQAAGISFLTFNLTCHDALAEGEFTDGHVEYVGGSISKFETCRDDIDAAVSQLNNRCSTIVLQGHSLGCDRVVDYLLYRQPEKIRAILLAPCDSYRLQADYLNGMRPEDQAAQLEQRSNKDGFDLLPESAYGVRRGGTWSYPIPVSKQTLMSIIRGPAFKLFNVENPIDYSVPNETLTVLGKNDALTAVGTDQMLEHLTQRFPRLTTILDAESDHCFAQRESWLAMQLVEWIMAHMGKH